MTTELDAAAGLVAIWHEMYQLEFSTAIEKSRSSVTSGSVWVESINTNRCPSQ